MRRMIRGAAAVVVMAVGLAGSTGCDEMGLANMALDSLGLGGGSGWDDSYGWGGGYGPIDDQVFENAASDWSDYIRG